MAGRYELRLFFSPVGNRATNVPVTVISADGERTITVNQRAKLPEGERSLSLGTFAFAAGKSGSVTIENEGTDGVVIADAVQFVPAPAAATQPATSPITSPAKSPATSSTATPADDAELLAAVRHCRDLIRAAQLPDGALRMGVTSDRVRIIPYFSNNAAMALLAAHAIDPQPDDVRRVRRWIGWYVAHMEPDGTIYDHAGTTSGYARTDRRDSTDSYAATFLQLLARHAKTDPPAAAALRPAAERALAAIGLTYDPADGLTWAKPDYRIKYTMDNLEVAMSLVEGIPYFVSVGATDSARRAQAMLEQSRKGLSDYWRPDLGYFAWAKGASGQYHVRMEKWYPDGIINLFAAAHVEGVPPALWRNLQASFADADELTPDWWLMAAHRAGSRQDVLRFQRKAIDFANAMDDKAQLNRLATTVLALVGDRAPGLKLTLDLDRRAD